MSNSFLKKGLSFLVLLSLIMGGLYAIYHYVSSLPKPVYTLTVTDNATRREIFTASGTEEITIEEQSENSIKFSYKNKAYAFSNCSITASDNVMNENKVAGMIMPITFVIVLFVCVSIILIVFLRR